jgi:hypothetical protein
MRIQVSLSEAFDAIRAQRGLDDDVVVCILDAEDDRRDLMTNYKEDLNGFDLRKSMIPAVKLIRDKYCLNLKDAVNIVKEIRGW